MFIKEARVKNFRLFPATTDFTVNLSVPDGVQPGSGLTVFIGENGCGKSSLLDAIALPLVPYKADDFDLRDFNDPSHGTEISILSENDFSVDGTMPKSNFMAKGFSFKANIRSRDNKAYLSSIVVSDQTYIKTVSDKPKDGSPDLRLAVNNPFKGKRFDENDILILDKNRTYQTRLGTYNSTRFDRLMEDFNFQYIKNSSPIPDIQITLNTIRDKPENTFLKQALEKFKEISNDDLYLNLIDNWRPFSKGFFAVNRDNNQQLQLSMLGSGYEMIFSLLIAFYLAKQSGKQLICLIDEPELHFHPTLQEKFVEILLDFAKTAQVVVATHSPLFIKQLSEVQNVGIQILRKEQSVLKSVPLSNGVLPYISSDEINYMAFGLATAEYHDALYGYIQETQQKYLEQEMIAYLNSKQQTNTKQWTPEKQGQTLPTVSVPIQVFIRNKLHHPENKAMSNSNFTHVELKQSIDEMIKIIKNP